MSLDSAPEADDSDISAISRLDDTPEPSPQTHQPRRVDVISSLGSLRRGATFADVSENQPETKAGRDDETYRTGSADGSAPVSMENDLIKFNFDNADLSEVIRSLAEIMGIKYVEDPDIQGKVTIHTAEAFPKAIYCRFFYGYSNRTGTRP